MYTSAALQISISATSPHLPQLTPSTTDQVTGHRWPSLGDGDSTGHFRTKVFLAVNHAVTVKCVNHMKADIRENATPCLIWPSGLRLPILTIMGDYGLEWNQWQWVLIFWHCLAGRRLAHWWLFSPSSQCIPKGFMLWPTSDLTDIFYVVLLHCHVSVYQIHQYVIPLYFSRPLVFKT